MATKLRRLVLAALVSGAAAGLLATLSLFLGATWLGGWSWDVAPAEAVLAVLAAGLAAGLIVAAPPAFLAGAAMDALGRRVGAARSPSAWAAAGAAVGALCWAVFAAAVGLAVGEPGLARPGGLLPAAILTGAGAALAFRGVAGRA
jgi:hypothetical protein